MTQMHSRSPKQVCECLLLEAKRYNLERSILPSEVAVVDRLLARSTELAGAYEELHKKLHAYPGALETLLGIVLSTAAFWNPEKIAEARARRSELANVNRQISKKAEELASLLQRRSDLHDRSGFSSDTHYHVCDVIEAAAKGNHLFTSYLIEPLHALRMQFDLKYWPPLGAFMQELASDATAAAPEALDALTAASTAAMRPSLSDFFRALFVAIEECSARNFGQLPNDFSVTDNTFAALANCALDLGSDNLVDSQYVKRLRQREREGAK